MFVSVCPGRSAGGGGRAEEKVEWGHDLQYRDAVDPSVLSLEGLGESDEEEEEEEDDAEVCAAGLDMRDDVELPLPPPPTSAPATRANGLGLMLKCEQHVAAGGSVLPPASLGASIVDVLRRNTRNDVELQTRLFELLGERVGG